MLTYVWYYVGRGNDRTDKLPTSEECVENKSYLSKFIMNSRLPGVFDHPHHISQSKSPCLLSKDTNAFHILPL